jgi:sugar lactone lactonase YvrE
MGYVDGPLDIVLAQVVEDEEELLRVRAWQVEESPEDLGYSVVKGWPRLPTGWRLGQVAGVAADHLGHYYLYHRGKEAPPLICFDRSGAYVRSWGEGVFDRPHMAKCDGEGNIWLIDDGGHALYLYSTEGEVVGKLGTRGVPGEDGAHFDRPTDIALGLDGGFYVSDGYDNRRVARFDAGLGFLGQWGSEGEGEGQFVLPHAITVGPKGLVYVADCTKWRVEIFSHKGEYLKQWTHIGKPFGLVYAPDGCFYVCDGTNARVTKMDVEGRIVGFFGSPSEGEGGLDNAHDIAVAPNGDILVAHLDGRAQLFERT